MGQFDVQQVCLNGHQITDNYLRHPEFRRARCPKCGQPTIHQCPECRTAIKGDYHVEGVFGFSKTPVPKFCESCGAQFPWGAALASDAVTKLNPPELLVQRRSEFAVPSANCFGIRYGEIAQKRAEQFGYGHAYSKKSEWS